MNGTLTIYFTNGENITIENCDKEIVKAPLNTNCVIEQDGKLCAINSKNVLYTVWKGTQDKPKSEIYSAVKDTMNSDCSKVGTTPLSI